MGNVEAFGKGFGALRVGVDDSDEFDAGQPAQGGDVAGFADPAGADQGDADGHGVSPGA